MILIYMIKMSYLKCRSEQIHKKMSRKLETDGKLQAA